MCTTVEWRSLFG